MNLTFYSEPYLILKNTTIFFNCHFLKENYWGGDKEKFLQFSKSDEVLTKTCSCKRGRTFHHNSFQAQSFKIDTNEPRKCNFKIKACANDENDLMSLGLWKHYFIKSNFHWKWVRIIFFKCTERNKNKFWNEVCAFKIYVCV